MVREADWKRVFLGLYLALGLLGLVSFAPFQAPDEIGHLLRACAVSEGQLVAETRPGTREAGALQAALKGWPPEAQKTDEFVPLLGEGTWVRHIRWLSFYGWQQAGSFRELEVDESAREFCNVPTLALYAPTNYAVPALGILLVRPFTDKLLAYLYAGRLLNWLAAGLCLYVAVSLAPRRWRMLWIAVALVPMNLQEYFSLAPDGLAFAFSALFLALVLHGRQQGRLSAPSLIFLYILAGLIALSKIVYLPLVLTACLLPPSCFGSVQRRWLCLLGLGAFALALNLAWLKVAAHILAVAAPPWSDPGVQKAFVLGEPLSYLGVLARTFMAKGTAYVWQMLGGELGWFTIHISHFVLALYGGLLLLGGLGSRAQEAGLPIGPGSRLLLLALVIGETVLIGTALYVQWTPPHASLIDGIQGRYFLPLLLPLGLALLPAAGSPLLSGRAGQHLWALALGLTAGTALLQGAAWNLGL